MMSEKILFVDDEIDILRAFKRNFAGKFTVDTALGGQEGLNSIVKDGPYAVVVSDYRMPGMDGIRFLAEVKNRAPDTTRMMLTGYADLNTAIDVVNKGQIFRFLTKPCPPEVLDAAISAGLEQYRLINMERELLEKTLRGSVQIMVEILSLINPSAFSRGLRIKKYVKHIVDTLRLSNSWQYEIAALLSQIGCVTLPPELLDLIAENVALNGNELKLFRSHPRIGKKILEKIPRLETAAGIIGAQQQSYQYRKAINTNPEDQDIIDLGGDILNIALEFDRLIMKGNSIKVALTELKRNKAKYNPDVLSALVAIESDSEEKKVISINLRELKVGMLLYNHVRAKENRMILVAKGQQATFVMIERLHAFEKTVGIEEPLYVVP